MEQGAIMAVPAHDSRDYAFAKPSICLSFPLVEGCDVSEESFDAKEGIVCNSPARMSLLIVTFLKRTDHQRSHRKDQRICENP